MGEPKEKEWYPDPTKWSEEQASRARAIADAGPQAFKGPESHYKRIVAAVGAYDKEAGFVAAAPVGMEAGAAPANDNAAPPAPAPTAPKPASPQPEANPWLQMGRDALQGAGDFLRGAGQGFTRGWGDEGAAALTPEVDDGTGIPRTYAEGSAYASMRDQNRRDNAEAQERSPWLYASGKVVGTAPGAIALSPLGAGGATSMTGMIGYGGLQGMGEGIVSGAGASEADTPMGVANDAAESGVYGGAMGAAFPVVSAGLLGLSNSMGKLADKARASALGTGSNSGKFRVLANQNGLDFVESDLGRSMDDLGYANKIIPQRASDYARKAAAGSARLGQEIGSLEDDALNQLALGDRMNLERGFGDIRQSLADNPAAIGDTQDNVVVEGIARLQKQPLTLTPRELHALKSKYEAAGGYVSDDIKLTPEGQRQIANQAMSDVARKELYDTMAQASPETAAAHKAAMSDYGKSKIIENLARDQAARNAARSMASIPRMIAASTGAGMGYTQGGAPGSVAGALAAYKGEQLLHDYGPDALANLARGGQNITGAIAKPFTAAAQVPAQGNAMGTLATEYLHPPAVQPRLLDMLAQTRQPPARAQSETQPDATNVTRSEDTAAREMLLADPNAFGEFSAQLQQAMQSKDPDALAAELYKLKHDATFREKYMPQLQE